MGTSLASCQHSIWTIRRDWKTNWDGWVEFIGVQTNNSEIWCTALDWLIASLCGVLLSIFGHQ